MAYSNALSSTNSQYPAVWHVLAHTKTIKGRYNKLTLYIILDVLLGLFCMVFGSWLTLYLYLCTIVLNVIFQIFFLRRALVNENIRWSKKYFFAVNIFLFYLCLVYLVTGLGTIWDIGLHDGVIRTSQIFLLPFNSSLYHWPYILNITMMIPLGFLLPFTWEQFRSITKVSLAGLFLSLLIESSQLLNNRTTTVDDLIMNTLGAMVGYFIFKTLLYIVRKVKGKEIGFHFNNGASSRVIRYEGLCYIIFSFLGVLFFFNAPLFSRLMLW